jgi:hypothetical protein
MPTVAEQFEIVIGVDTHAATRTHTRTAAGWHRRCGPVPGNACWSGPSCRVDQAPQRGTR